MASNKGFFQEEIHQVLNPHLTQRTLISGYAGHPAHNTVSMSLHV